MSSPRSIVVEGIPHGLSDEVIKQYFFSKAGDIEVFRFYEDERKAHIVFQDSGVVSQILSSTHKIGRHIIKVKRVEKDDSQTHAIGGTSGQKSVAAGGVETSPQQNKSTSMATKCVEFKPQQWKVVSLARPDMVKAIESQARKHGVIITYPAESSYIKICGCSPQVSEIEEHFEDLKNYVIVSSKTLQWSPGLWMVMKSMKDSICLLEHDYPVAIDIKAVTSESTDGAECQTVFTAQLGENRIEICFGNFTKYSSATTIINLMVRNMDGYHLHELVETGGKEILSDLESRMKELSLCELPQVFETKPRNLPVRKLIHCVVYNWRQSDVKVARVLEEGVKHALRSSSPPYIVVAQSTAIQCPPVVLAEVITKEILSSSCSFSGAHFALFITSKEDEKALEQFFQSRRATMQFNDASKLLDKCDGNSNTHIAVLHDHLSFLSIINGDLMKQKVQVYVNSTNADLDLSRGMLSIQLLKLMGQKLQDQCKEYAPLGFGKVAVTSAENMLCDVILHVSLPAYNVKGSRKVFREAVQNVLRICFSQSLSSIGFPSLGAGKLGYPDHFVADVIISEVMAFNEKHPSFLKQVVLVLAEKDIYGHFMKVYAEKLQTSTTEMVIVEEKTLTETHATVLHINCGIEDENFDVILNPISASPDTLQTPLLQLLSQKDGESLQILCSQLVEGGVTVNEKMRVFTKGIGQLRCKKILHVFNPNSSDDLHLVVLNALNQAEQQQYKSLCMPLFGCGIPLEERTITIIQACVEFGQRDPEYLKRIVLVVNDKSSYESVCMCLAEVKGRCRGQSYCTVDEAVNFMDLQYWSLLPSKRRSLQPWDTVDFHTLENKDAVVNVYCCMAKQGNKIVAEIESRVMKELVTDHVDDDHIQSLIASEVIDVKNKVRMLGVGMKFFRGKGRVTLSGDKSKVKDAKSYIVKVLSSLRHAKSLLNQIVWQRETDSGLEMIHEEISCRLENARIKDTHLLKVHSGVHSCLIDLRSMLEIDLSSGKTYPVRRMEKPKIALPLYWQPQPFQDGKEKACHLVPVSSSSEEYEIAVKEFSETMHGINFSIVSLERVQNFDEYSKHCAFLDVLKRKYGGEVLVKRLFHGTSSHSVEAIAHQGFNRIFAADANAAFFGKGVYFASRANYSAQKKYSTPDDHGNQKMFVCRVVVGKYTKGEKTMKVAPPLDATRNKHLLFDTLVDNVTNPTIFVVMSDSQAYPEYVVSFRIF